MKDEDGEALGGKRASIQFAHQRKAKEDLQLAEKISGVGEVSSAILDEIE
jgi:hypothetical protein